MAWSDDAPAERSFQREKDEIPGGLPTGPRRTARGAPHPDEPSHLWLLLVAPAGRASHSRVGRRQRTRSRSPRSDEPGRPMTTALH